MRAACVLVLLLAVAASAWAEQAELSVDGPPETEVFAVSQYEIRFAGALSPFAELPDDQVNDAYDADRDGVFLRIGVEFSCSGSAPLSLALPAFAMRDAAQGPWHWRVRFAPTRPGTWNGSLTLDGAATAGAPAVHRVVPLGFPINASVRADAEGPLVAGSPWLRELRADGSSVPRWQFGACRAWVVESDAAGDGFAPFEGLDRARDLFPLLRANGYNLLSQWMAPWEFQLVHRDRAEFWRDEHGSWSRRALPQEAHWRPWACYDQGRAAAFDTLVRQCEGGPHESTIRLLFAPLPHRCVEMAGSGEPGPTSNWRAPAEGGGQAPMKLCGFSAFKPEMDAWEFFAADPALPTGDWRSRLFDAEANYFRYLVARWSASRAIGVWVLMDEIDMTGDQLSLLARGNGWFSHPECELWLGSLVRMMKGALKRSDGLSYAGDPYAHPLHASTTSIGSEFQPGANLEWRWPEVGGAATDALQLVGWHWYPRLRSGMTYDDAWTYTVDGIAAFSARSRLDHQARLIGEFGVPDRQGPEDEPSTLYPTLYHMGAWAAIFSGQAGTVMDWDDGKEFGELRWRDQPGAFDHDRYPVDNAAQVKAMRRILAPLDPGRLRPLPLGQPLHVDAPVGGRVFVLATTSGPFALHGWVLCPARRGTMVINGLAPGTYRVAFDDPWLGSALAPASALREVGADGQLAIALEAVLGLMRPELPFPRQGRLDRGKDAVFHLLAGER
jgi:hypothetical protein